MATMSASDGRAHSAERNGFGDRDDQQRAALVQRFRQFRNRFNDAKEIRRLHEDGGDVVFQAGLQSCDIDGAVGLHADFFHDQAGILRVGLQHRAIFRMHRTRDEDAAAAGESFGHQHRFGGGSGAVVHGGVGDFLAGQLAHQGLKFEDGLQRALGDFGLIGRVGSQKFAALNNGVGDYRAQMVVDAGTQKTGVAERIFWARGVFETFDDFG